MRVAIFTEDMYEDVEFWYPYYRLKEAGHHPVVIGSGRKEGFEGKHGVPNKADMSIKDARSADFDAVVVPGGYAPDKMRLHPEFAQLVRLVHDEGKLVASLCHGPWILASAGILNGRKVTCWPSLKDDMMNAGARYQDQAVVVDGNIITSRMPDDLPVFMAEVVRFLGPGQEARGERITTVSASGR
ncbi:MAG: type 1 glutamine amidotransferase domain-containing protein [Methanomassiliicoccus sp.]|nr:type 1 glutamine amidotransferase domain-containing protein [Methanomassiliicoccus sp.]